MTLGQWWPIPLGKGRWARCGEGTKSGVALRLLSSDRTGRAGVSGEQEGLKTQIKSRQHKGSEENFSFCG